jgi:hypothetical protein
VKFKNEKESVATGRQRFCTFDKLFRLVFGRRGDGTRVSNKMDDGMNQ